MSIKSGRHAVKDVSRVPKEEVTEPYWTTSEFATYLNKPVSWVYDNVERLGIPSHRIGRQFRFRRSEVEAWIDGRRS